MRVHLINPSDTSFGIGVITPRWLYVLAAATPAEYGDPLITDETLDQIQPDLIQPGDVVGIATRQDTGEQGECSDLVLDIGGNRPAIAVAAADWRLDAS